MWNIQDRQTNNKIKTKWLKPKTTNTKNLKKNYLLVTIWWLEINIYKKRPKTGKKTKAEQKEEQA